MNQADAAAMCETYKLGVDDLRIAGAAELLLGERFKDASKDTLVRELARKMGDVEFASVVKWATWVKHAKTTGKPGADVASLLAIRKRLKDDGSTTVQGSDEDS